MLTLPSRIGRYEIKSVIGAGGMGSLYLARDTNPTTNRLVAIKLLNANLESEDLRDRFAREARSLAALSHSCIVDIYDSGEFEDAPFIVMEYVRGETLAEMIKRRAPLTIRQKLTLMIELCSGLGHAHDAGIIHRDIKPANLMVDLHGRLKILDFGIARQSESNMTRLGMQMTQLNVRIGTPGYMAPEQIEGGEVDRRSDLFAVGSVFYELLSYREAFTGTSSWQVENAVLQDKPAPLSSLMPGLDPEIEGIVNRALEKDPSRRYQDAASFEAAIEGQRWRLGPLITPVTMSRPTPVPGPGRKGRDNRADLAYQRAVALDQEGAHDAARRFAIEALAEDPDHQTARAFLEGSGPKARATALVSAPFLLPETSASPTEFIPANYPAGASVPQQETVLVTTHRPAAKPKTRRSRNALWTSVTGLWNTRLDLWRRHGRHVQIGGLVAAVVALVAGAVLLGFWVFGQSGLPLTVTRPLGGTILGDGINCGSEGSACTTNVTAGRAIELRAEADRGFIFAGFAGDCMSGGRVLMDGPRTCSAKFEVDPGTAPVPPSAGNPTAPTPPTMLSLTLLPPKNGTIVGPGNIQCGSLGSGRCSVDWESGREVGIKGLPDLNFMLLHYTGDCDPKTGVTVMDGPRTCGAVFGPVSKPVAPNLSAGPAPAPSRPRPNVGPTTPNTTGSGETVVNPEPAAPTGPPATPVPPPKSPNEIAKEEIQKSLDQYRAAYRKLDFAELKRIYPAAPNSIRDQFRQFKEIRYEFQGALDYVDLDPVLGTATVKVDAELTPKDKAGSQSAYQRKDEFKLKRLDNVWVISELMSGPK